MFSLFITGLVIGAVTIIFALQNIVPVTVNFLGWTIEGSLALVLAIAALAGATVGAFLTIPGVIKNYFKFENLKKQNKDLEKSLEKEKNAPKIVLVDANDKVVEASDKALNE